MCIAEGHCWTDIIWEAVICSSVLLNRSEIMPNTNNFLRNRPNEENRSTGGTTTIIAQELPTRSRSIVSVRFIIQRASVDAAAVITSKMLGAEQNVKQS